MKTLDEIKADAQKIADLATAVQKAVEAQAKAIAATNADRTRSGEWKLAEVARIRKESTVPAQFLEIRARYDELQNVRESMTTPFYVLGRERILPGTVDANLEADEAMVRQNFRTELGLMPLGAAKVSTREGQLS